MHNYKTDLKNRSPKNETIFEWCFCHEMSKWQNFFLVNYFFKITDHRNIVCPMLCFDLFCFESKLRSFFCISTSMLLVCACVLPSSLLALCYSRLLLQNWRSGEWEVLLWVWVVCVRQSITGVCLRVFQGSDAGHGTVSATLVSRQWWPGVTGFLPVHTTLHMVSQCLCLYVQFVLLHSCMN